MAQHLLGDNRPWIDSKFKFEKFRSYRWSQKQIGDAEYEIRRNGVLVLSWLSLISKPFLLLKRMDADIIVDELAVQVGALPEHTKDKKIWDILPPDTFQLFTWVDNVWTTEEHSDIPHDHIVEIATPENLERIHEAFTAVWIWAENGSRPKNLILEALGFGQVCPCGATFFSGSSIRCDECDTDYFERIDE
ncbi:hypothetical protein ACFL41_02275 [Gemmatimonadota bacterium]